MIYVKNQHYKDTRKLDFSSLEFAGFNWKTTDSLHSFIIMTTNIYPRIAEHLIIGPGSIYHRTMVYISSDPGPMKYAPWSDDKLFTNKKTNYSSIRATLSLPNEV